LKVSSRLFPLRKESAKQRTSHLQKVKVRANLLLVNFLAGHIHLLFKRSRLLPTKSPHHGSPTSLCNSPEKILVLPPSFKNPDTYRVIWAIYRNQLTQIASSKFLKSNFYLISHSLSFLQECRRKNFVPRSHGSTKPS
jgi:hypothetical protein